MSEKFFPYKNLGVQDSFTKTVEIVKTDNEKYSSTGSYFVVPRSVGKQNILNYPSGTTEVWIRFDLYIAHSGGYNNPPCVGHYVNGCEDGIRFNNGTIERIYANSTKLDFSYSVLLTGLHSYVLHMRAGDSETGKIEVSVDGSTILSETCEVAQLNGGIFSGACFFSNDHAYCFSDVVISDQQIAETDHGYNDERVMFYTSRNVSNVTLGTFDTSRNVKNGYFVDQPFDTVRRVKGNINISFDTLRDVSNYLISAHYDGDLIRKVTKDVDTAFDTKREVDREADQPCDTFRKVKKTITFYIDIERDAHDIEKFHVDVLVRHPVATTIEANVPATTNPFNPQAVSQKQGVQSIEITLGEMTFSDTFRLVTTQALNVNDIIRGQILDFPYVYAVESTDQRDALLTAEGMYDKDATMFFPFRFISETYVSNLQEQLRKQGKNDTVPISTYDIIKPIAKALGLGLVYRGTTYLLDMADYAGDGHTYQGMVSSAFGWSNKIPMHQINVFMRASDNAIHVVQRGYESKVTDITDTKHTRPTVHREIVRTTWASKNDDDDDTDDGNYHEPYTGLKHYGGVWMQYILGLLVHTETPTQNGYTSVDYKYDHIGWSPDPTSPTNICHLLYQTTRTYEDGDLVSTSRTKYINPYEVPGFQYAYTKTDGEFAGASLSQQDPDARPSRYYDEMYYSRLDPDDEQKEKHDSFIPDVGLPLVDEDPHKLAIVAEVKWMNRMVKETVTMDIYNSNHVYDFDERFVFRGNEYFLVSNKIAQDTRSLKQSITMVRWFR